MGDCHSFDPGSNPGPGVQSRLRIPTKKERIKELDKTIDIKGTDIDNSKAFVDISKNRCEMRDLYNRKQRLKCCINRIHSDFSGKDKTDLLKFLEIMQEKEQSELTIIRCVSIMTQVQKYLKKSFCKMTKDDIKNLFR